MTLEELIASFREDSNDELEPYLWGDEAVTRWLNEAQDEAAVRGRLLDQVRNGEDTFMALIEGVDDAWEVSLLKFTVEMIQKSHEINIFDFKRKGLL